MKNICVGGNVFKPLDRPTYAKCVETCLQFKDCVGFVYRVGKKRCTLLSAFVRSTCGTQNRTLKNWIYSQKCGLADDCKTTPKTTTTTTTSQPTTSESYNTTRIS